MSNPQKDHSAKTGWGHSSVFRSFPCIAALLLFLHVFLDPHCFPAFYTVGVSDPLLRWQDCALFKTYVMELIITHLVWGAMVETFHSKLEIIYNNLDDPTARGKFLLPRDIPYFEIVLSEYFCRKFENWPLYARQNHPCAWLFTKSATVYKGKKLGIHFTTNSFTRRLQYHSLISIARPTSLQQKVKADGRVLLLQCN